MMSVAGKLSPETNSQASQIAEFEPDLPTWATAVVTVFTVSVLGLSLGFGIKALVKSGRLPSFRQTRGKYRVSRHQ